MTELLAGIMVAGVALALVLEPMVRGRPWTAATGALDEELDFADIEESESPKVRALLAIKEIEFDRETGKLSDEDYQSLKATYQRAALAAIMVDDGQADSQCTACGEVVSAGAKFCGECGTAVVR